MHKSSMDAMRRFVTDHLASFEGKPLQILDVGSMDVNGSYPRPQPVEAIPLVRSSAKTSAGFLQSRILRGRPLISRATAHR